MAVDIARASNVEVLHAAVEAFQKREINFRDILEELPAAIYTTDAEGHITYFNKACVAFSGRMPKIGDLWCVSWKLFTIDGRPLPHAECPMAIALRRQRAVRGVEAIAERPDGSRINFLPYPTPIFDERGNLLGAVNMLVDITEQKRSQEHLALMAREIDHRANNLLSVMQGLLHLTKAETVPEYVAVLKGRFAALARANNLIAGGRWLNVDFKELVEGEIAAFAKERVKITGEPINIKPASAQCLGLMLHELGTNALNYGALSVEEGAVSISWAVDDAGSLMLQWTEEGGPPVSLATRQGAGSALIAGVVRQLQGDIFRDWLPSGLRCTFLCNAANL